MITFLKLKNLGPAPALEIHFSPRLNVITGDNGLGKTFLLDLAWWALTRSWPDGKVIRPTKANTETSLEFQVHGKAGPVDPVKLTYSIDARDWSSFRQGPPPSPGLVIYARIDGGFSVKDPERNRWRDQDDSGRTLPRPESFQFSKRQVWEGLKDADGKVLCRGLIEDWETWRYKAPKTFELLNEVLETLSSDEDNPLRLGEAARLPELGAVDVPTIEMSYGNVPILHASAGVRRILSLAYMVVWAWSEHRIEAEGREHESAKRIVLIWDEIEAHLHPKWQLTILPAVVEVLERLLKKTDGTQLQVIATTHAPLVLASMETEWSEKNDKLFNLELSKDGRSAEVEEVRWAKFGDASGWLASPAFDLESGYAPEAEKAMQAADYLMAGPNYADRLPEGLKDVDSIHAELIRTLDGGNQYWPLWLPYYRRMKGIKK